MLTMLMMMAPRNACPKPCTVLRWGLLFISGVFVPLVEISPAARTLAYLSPLTYAQDLMSYAVPSARGEPPGVRAPVMGEMQQPTRTRRFGR